VLLLAIAASSCYSLFGPPPLDRNWNVVDGPRVSF